MQEDYILSGNEFKTNVTFFFKIDQLYVIW